MRGQHDEHANELEHYVAGIESDMGVFKPTGYSVERGDDARAARAVGQLSDLLSVFPPRRSARPMRASASAGVVLLGHQVENANYFDLHHSPPDTLDKVDPSVLSENLAVLAVTAYILAEMPERLGELPAAEQTVGNCPATAGVKPACQQQEHG